MYTVYSVQCTMYSVHLPTLSMADPDTVVGRTRVALHSVDKLQCTVYSGDSVLCIQYKSYSVYSLQYLYLQCTMYSLYINSVHCTWYNVHGTVYSVYSEHCGNFTVHSVQCGQFKPLGCVLCIKV